MARREKVDRVLLTKMANIEQRMNLLKLTYEKYFAGTDPIEPIKERETLKRDMRDIDRTPMNSTREKYRWRSVKARMSSLENYWQRNLVMIERGTHPKMKFRADAKERAAGQHSQNSATARLEAQRQARAREEAKEGQMRELFNEYMKARKQCGQDSNMNYRQVRAALNNQARSIQTKESCKDVKFKVKVKGGKASITAIPVR
ncbi:MAG: MXAN_5187 C-terminal domain-containing protein [Myxococcota bacterium]|nr:MXAN_5187 C-terminal domain-containing protein [Myxococcota bacterium]MEC9389310.1 MXAN_5187 C-terminal domain-containing protein [Myxococcota bacterium]